MPDLAQVAALYVELGGTYYELDGVDPWGLPERDAREYAGPWPVVAHPPCNRWSMPLAKVNETRYGHKVGDDGGCFAAALSAVRRFGGVLEHPANTAAFAAHGLCKPTRAWSRCLDGGWVCMVSQSAYGHRALKRTWLYFFGDALPPSLRWDEPPATALVSWLQRTTSSLPRMNQREAKATPVEFRDALLGMARSAGGA